jgi:hypothetical protein
VAAQKEEKEKNRISFVNDYEVVEKYIIFAPNFKI